MVRPVGVFDPPPPSVEGEQGVLNVPTSKGQNLPNPILQLKDLGRATGRTTGACGRARLGAPRPISARIGAPLGSVKGPKKL